MKITINIFYMGENENALKFIKEMHSLGIVDKIRNEKGNISYKYYISYSNPNAVLLIDKRENQEALDNHHKSEMMKTIMELRKKYNLKLHVERYVDDKNNYEDDNKYIK